MRNGFDRELSLFGKFALAVGFCAMFVFGCGAPKKIDIVRQQKLQAQLALSRSELEEERKVIESGRKDTIRVKDETTGEEQFIMHAVKDESGEMVATEVLNAAVITARFRNIAERHGKIDIRFEVIVPKEMQDPNWQLRFYPDMFILEDSLRLESVIITGENYRKQQLRGYELYYKYLAGIITDPNAFIDWRNLNIWISRNIPELYKYRNDSSYVAETEFYSAFGTTEEDAIRHYTNTFSKNKNNRMWDERDKVFHKYVKVPIDSTNVRIDTVLRNNNGDFVYSYVETIRTRPKLKKVDVVLSGDIFQSDELLYEMSRTEPLTFYISSVSSFVDGTERYLTKTISRRAAANTACYVDFAQGKSDLDIDMGKNREEMGRIRDNILQLLQNEKFDLDSIVIAASASPEGSISANGALAERRAASVAKYYSDYIRHYNDSLRRNAALTVTVDDSGHERMGREKVETQDIKFLSRSNGENWQMLTVLVDEDSTLTQEDKRSFVRYMEIADVDRREHEMQKEPYYKYVRENLYPRLRTVKFDFFLHRKGMIVEEMETTELDTTYMKGVAALRDRDYELAITLLRPYQDFNTAVAFVAMDYNASAMAILQNLERTPQVNYMLALLYARNGDDEKAVQCYVNACKQDRSYVFRGNLDPEIYVLIQRYGLNKQDDDEFTDAY